MAVFEHSDYRLAFKEVCEAWKSSGAGRTFQRLAKAAGVHPPYLTNVLKEKAHLNSDQLYSSLKHMGSTQVEIDYMILLMEEDKCVVQSRKQALKQQLDKIRSTQNKTQAHIKAEVIAPAADNLSRYYLDSTIRIVYNFLGIAEYAANPESIANALNIGVANVQHSIDYLIEVGLIAKNTDGELVKTKTKMHLPKESHLFEAHKKLFHYRCLDHQDRTRNESDYNFTLTFTGDQNVKSEVKKKFLQFLSEIQPLVEAAEPEEVFQLNFDLFNWS